MELNYKAQADVNTIKWSKIVFLYQKVYRKKHLEI